MQALIFVAFGGALGSMARYGLGQLLQNTWNGAFPMATWIVNILGSTLIGAIAAVAAYKGWQAAHPVWLVAGIGFCGGFTTFSTFSLEAYQLIRQGQIAPAGYYMFGSTLFCLIGTWVGYSLVKYFFS
jgi:fluoride exporter